MTLIQNEPKKIYLWVEQTGPSLKSYAEIQAMSMSDAITELNTYPIEYYNKFDTEGRLIELSTLRPTGAGLKGMQYQIYDNYFAYNYTSSYNSTWGIASGARGQYIN